eukprot:SAG31_NODE_16365_length_712_cov_0.628059_2_plen_145_part_01
MSGVGDNLPMAAIPSRVAAPGGKVHEYVLTTGSPVTTAVLQVHTRSTQCPAGGAVWLSNFRRHVASLQPVVAAAASHRIFWQNAFSKMHLLVGAGSGCVGCPSPSASQNIAGEKGLSAFGQILNQRIAVSRYMDLAAGRGSFPQH